MPKPVVLLVDPNPVRRDLIFSCLAQRWSPLVCSRGGSAPTIVDSHPVAAALISLGQRDENGLAVCQAIRGRPNGRSLFTVVYGQPAGPPVSETLRVKLERTCGVDRFLVRELSPSDLAALLDEGLRARSDAAPAAPAAPPVASAGKAQVRSARIADDPEPSWEELLTAEASPEVLKKALRKEITWGQLLAQRLEGMDLREVMTREFGVRRDPGEEDYSWRELMGAEVTAENLLRLLRKRVI